MKQLMNKGLLLFLAIFAMGCKQEEAKQAAAEPVDLVNPYMGNISHLLVPTYPTIHLPNSMLRVYPQREDYTGDLLHGLPVEVTSHRGRSAFHLSPYQGNMDSVPNVIQYHYDQEKLTPYSYSVILEEGNIGVAYAPSHQAARYELDFEGTGTRSLIVSSDRGSVQWDGEGLSAVQEIANHTQVFLYLKPDTAPQQLKVLHDGALMDLGQASEDTSGMVLQFAADSTALGINYGISFIDADQAKRNMEREVAGKDLVALQKTGRDLWNKTLGKIAIEGGSEADRHVFYTSLYRCFERPVAISEDGRYYSAFDGSVHQDNGNTFYTDDWIWDSYRAHHPLRVLLDPEKESDILRSFVTMAQQMDSLWMPTFPEITGDSRRMNSNHAVASVLDASRKGIKGFDLETAYLAAKKGITEKTLAPWSGKPAGQLDAFYKEHGYIPALHEGETETIPEVNGFEKRQPVAVTLGTSYDEWCLAQLAHDLGKTSDAEHFMKEAHNYRNLFNPNTHFFHPKDSKGAFIEPFDYRFSGGLGARNYYGENNGWVYRWDVQHNIADLISLMGGRDSLTENLDQMFATPLGRGKSSFYAQLPDHTGNVGQFSMANEPSLHVPYLYVYAGKPWKTQKRIKELVHTWFRNDLMGVPGDEDGGGMSSFVVFSQMGFYPVTPGLPMYVIGSPFFDRASIQLDNGKTFTVLAKGLSTENKYIQSATLNGKAWERPWFSHAQLMQGGTLELVMGNRPNTTWGSSPNAAPPSLTMDIGKLN